MSIPGSKTLLMGPPGVGKTYSLQTLLDAKLEVFCLFFEPRFGCLGQTPADRFHWHYLKPADASWEALRAMADLVNKLPFDALTKMPDPKRQEHNQLLEVYRAFINFPDDRSGKTFGPIDSWGPDRVLCIDALTGLSNLAMNLMVGGRPTRDQKDWGVAQNVLEQLLIKLTSSLQCHLVMTAHVEREFIEAQSSVLLTVSSLGKALPPKIPRLFDDVVLGQRIGKEFSWSNATTGADTKPGYLPLSEKLPPTFVPLIESWRKQTT